MLPMTKAQRNQIIRALIAGNLDPAECELDNVEDSYTIRHVPSASAITWTQGLVGASVRTRIGADPARVSMIINNNFGIFADNVCKWASNVRDWVETPDLWALSRSGGSLPGGLASDSANTPFTPEEQKAISAHLKSIAESVKRNYELTAEQSAKLDEKFEEAEKASRRIGRKDWACCLAEPCSR